MKQMFKNNNDNLKQMYNNYNNNNNIMKLLYNNFNMRKQM